MEIFGVIFINNAFIITNMHSITFTHFICLYSAALTLANTRQIFLFKHKGYLIARYSDHFSLVHTN